MTDAEKYIALVKCDHEYRFKMPHNVKSIELINTGRSDYPELIEIHWKSGDKSAIGNPKAVEALKPFIGAVKTFRDNALKLINEDKEALRPAAKADAEKNRPWTYILGVIDENGNRVERYSWTEDNSWELFGMSDSELLQERIDTCRRFRSESTSRWHVYKRMRGSTELKVVY